LEKGHIKIIFIKNFSYVPSGGDFEYLRTVLYYLGLIFRLFGADFVFLIGNKIEGKFFVIFGTNCNIIFGKPVISHLEPYAVLIRIIAVLIRNEHVTCLVMRSNMCLYTVSFFFFGPTLCMRLIQFTLIGLNFNDKSENIKTSVNLSM